LQNLELHTLLPLPLQGFGSLLWLAASPLLAPVWQQGLLFFQLFAASLSSQGLDLLKQEPLDMKCFRYCLLRALVMTPCLLHLLPLACLCCWLLIAYPAAA